MKKRLLLIICLLLTVFSAVGCFSITVIDKSNDSTTASGSPSPTKKPEKKPNSSVPEATDTKETDAEKVTDNETTNTEASHVHSYASETVAASCSEGGYTKYTCSCGNSYTENETAPLDHSYTEEKIGATCSQGAQTRYTCKSCGYSYFETTSDPAPHDYKAEKFNATCTEEGLTRYTCQNCTYSFTEDHIPPIGHNYEKTKTVEPTATTQGYSIYTCKECGATYNGDYVDKLAGNGQGSGNVPATAFDDCVFLGDSVSDMLELYNKSNNIFGRATFLTETSYSLYHCIQMGKTVSYNGQQMTPEDAIAACGAKTVFIMLGTNDLVWANIDSTVENFKTLISRIRSKCPGIQIVVQSQTPIFTAGQKDGLTNERVNEYNQKLMSMAASTGCAYVDIATPLKDSTGGLAKEYTSDNYVHINGAACLVWQATLKAFLGM